MKSHFVHVEDRVRQIVKRRQAEVRFGAFKQSYRSQDGSQVTIAFEHPTLIWRAPARGSAGRSSRQRAIFVDGSFSYIDEQMAGARAVLAVYDIAQHQDAYTLELLDSMHFDVESIEQKAFHPLFHVQRGQIKQPAWSASSLRELVAKVARTDVENITIVDPERVARLDVRIPTPQMDYLAVLLTVVADFFGDSTSSEMKKGFADLIRHVQKAENLARHGQQADELFRRCTGADPKGYCVAHWYPESVSALRA